jgi:hypothetical protein
VGTWNVQTLYRSEALKNLVNAVQECNVYIMVIWEMIWIGQNIMNKKTCIIAAIIVYTNFEQGS